MCRLSDPRHSFTTMYELLVFVHILSAVVWVGGGVFVQVQARQTFRNGDQAAIGKYIDSLEEVSKVIFNVAPPLTLLAGIGLVVWSPAWGFSQFWVYGALALVALSIVFGAVLSGKAMGTIRDAAGSGDGRSLAAGISNLARFSAIDILVLLAILALMVFKPGV